MHLIADGLVKRYKAFLAVERVDFALEAGQFLSLLGPSGCGKTTTLRMLAGFVEPDDGRIRLAGQDITRVPARRRNIGMVFQNYALFPHMSVADNVAFGLKMRHVASNETARRVARSLEMVRMEGYSTARPGELSGGQQQRVALARALVIEPTLLLLDEPLSALDLKLREELREEIGRITDELNITTVFVTHDQNEALVLSDLVAVMNRGRIEQIDTPEALFGRPATPFVAKFLGGSNVIEGRVAARDGRDATLEVEDGLRLQVRDLPGPAVQGTKVTVSIRPEAIRPAGGGLPANLAATVRKRRFLGSQDEYLVGTGSGRLLVVRWPAGSALAPGSKVDLHVPTEAVVPLRESPLAELDTTQGVRA